MYFREELCRFVFCFSSGQLFCQKIKSIKANTGQSAGRSTIILCTQKSDSVYIKINGVVPTFWFCITLLFLVSE